MPWAVAGAQTAEAPLRTEDNVIVAAYNIQFLGEREHRYDKLAQVIQHFDVCGILEVKKEDAVRALVTALEDLTQKDWGYVFGVRTHRPGCSYHEAYAAVWRKDRVELGGGLIGGVWDPGEAFRNDPYLVSFKRKGFDFTLFLLHTRWSDDAEGTRAEEVATVAEQLLWMRTFLSERDWIVAGDFNYAGTKKAMVDMAARAGLVQLDPNQQSTFKRNNSGYASAYDHIYVSPDETGEYIAGSCKTLDSTRLVYGDNTTDSMGTSKRELSDHLPVYAVFDVSQPDDD